MFIIYNTMTFSVLQRRTLLGRLRSLGVTRREIVRLILSEALWMGFVGSILGVAVGTILGRGLVRLVTRTINDLYFAVSLERVAIDPWILAKGAALGVAATLLAAVPPVIEAASVPARIATLRSTIEEKARWMVRRAALWGALSGGTGGILLALPSRSLVLSLSGLFFVMLGLALLTPLCTVALTALLRRPLAWVGGMVGLMAARGVVTTLSRTAPAIAALVVAVSVTVGLGTMIGSFRGTLVRWLEGTLQADVYVSLPSPQASAASGTLWPDVIESFVAHPQVVGHSTYRGLDTFTDEGVFRLVALDQDPRGDRAFDFIEETSGGALEAFRAGEGLLVSEPFAYRRGIGVGDSVRLSTPTGPRSIPVAGVFYDYASDQGVVMIARSLYDTWYSDPGVTSLGLYLAEDADSEQVVSELSAGVPEGRAVLIRSNDTLRSASLQVFDRTFRVTGVLRVLAFIVAFVGIMSALMAVELEREGELGLLRATGLTPGQLWKLVTTQTGLIGLLSGLMAIPVGIVLSIVMIYVVNKRSFGWTLRMELDSVVLGQAILIALASALLAGVYPAWRMSRTSPARALRSE
jgi:putative ABC transport system permease protein